jgi:hypothetical protein
MNKHDYHAQIYRHGRNGQQTNFGESQTDISRRLDHSSQHLRTSVSTRSSPDDSNKEREKARSTAGVIAARLLAVLVPAMVITSILGLTAFDRQGGNSATAIASLAIGSVAAVLGMGWGFIKAYEEAYNPNKRRSRPDTSRTRHLRPGGPSTTDTELVPVDRVDPVGVAEGRQSMCGHDHGATGGEISTHAELLVSAPVNRSSAARGPRLPPAM